VKDTKPFLKGSSNRPCPLAGEAAPAALKQTVATGEVLPLADTLSRIDTWVFDLDNTLYPADCDLWPKIDQRITLYLSYLFGLGIGPKEFLDFTHDIDRSSLLPDLALASAITALPGRKLILTNGSREHAFRTAGALGLEAMFEDIFDIADADFVPKPAAATYERFFERHAVDPARAVMFEDLAKNLIIPHERGMTTVLVVPKPGQMDHREAFEIARGEATSYIDFVTSDLARFLTGLAPDAPDTADA
jgi:putative hydrolase of the HAD superfamily